MNPSARAFLGISHTPLLGRNPIALAAQTELDGALVSVRKAVTAWQPDRIVLIGPDHYNGFVNELMPTFCVGTQASAIGDFDTPAGPLNVDAALALKLADYLMDHDFDPAVSRRMRVDHGFAQPLQLLWGSLATPPVIPIFFNAVAAPTIARNRRCITLGAAIGNFLEPLPGRTLLIGSGGLSHEPPVPTLDHPDPAVRERITVRQTPTPAEREARVQRTIAAGKALAAGDPAIKPLNADWDRQWMDALASGKLETLAAISEASIAQDAGRSAHESKTWLIARSALRQDAPVRLLFSYYQAIPAYIAGFGLLLMQSD